MSTWPVLSLGQVCEINPRMPKGHNLADETEVSFVPMAAVNEVSGTITKGQSRKFANVKKGYTPFSNGDVLFAKITPCMENGKSAIASDLQNGIGFGSTEFHVLRADRHVLPEWLYYFVRREPFRQEAKRSFTGTAGQQRVPTSFMESAKIPMPPIDEQRRIVDLLTRAEGISNLRREARTKASRLIPAIFHNLFGDPFANPNQWPVRPLGDVSAVISGAAKGREIAPKEAIELPYLRVANVKDGYLDLKEIKTLRIKRNEVERLAIEPGDLLMTEGGDADKLGRAALWRGEIELCVHQNHVFKVRADRSIVLPEYLRALAGSAYGKSYFFRVAKRTTGIASINKTQLSAFPIFLPPLKRQRVFVELVAAAESIHRLQQDAIAKAQATFDALLTTTFSDKQNA